MVGALAVAACGESQTDTTPAPLVTSVPDSTTTTLRVEEAKALVQSQYNALITTAEGLRGLTFTSPPSLVFVGPNEIEAAVIPDTLRIDVLDGMGFGSPGPSGQIIQYQPDRNQVAMVTPRTDLTPYARAEVIEALVLALVYEHFPSPDGLDGEAGLGLIGLRNGDAAFHRNEFVETFLTSTERFALRLESVRQDESEMALPAYALTFERVGDEVAVVLVTHLISDQGIDGLNDAYRRPPETTEQLFHPDSYRRNTKAISVSLPATVGSGMLPAESGNMGELWLRSLFSHSLGAAEMLQATTGWDGDTYTVWQRRDDLALSNLIVLESEQDALELRDGLAHWALNAFALAAGRTDHRGVVFEGDGFVYVAQVDNEVLFVASPDRLLGQKVREQFWPRY